MCSKYIIYIELSGISFSSLCIRSLLNNAPNYLRRWVLYPKEILEHFVHIARRWWRGFVVGIAQQAKVRRQQLKMRGWRLCQHLRKIDCCRILYNLMPATPQYCKIRTKLKLFFIEKDNKIKNYCHIRGCNGWWFEKAKISKNVNSSPFFGPKHIGSTEINSESTVYWYDGASSNLNIWHIWLYFWLNSH